MHSIPGLGRSPGGGHGNPLQYSCLENPTDRGAWLATVSLWGHERVGHDLATESELAQSCPTLCDPMDCSLSGSSVHGIFQQEYWSALPFPSPRDLPDPGFELGSPTFQADALPSEPPGKLSDKQHIHVTCIF